MGTRTSEERVPQDESEAAAFEAARLLARTLAESPAFRSFEAAYHRFEADESAQQKLRKFQVKQREVRQAAMWGGAGTAEQEELDREWAALCAIPTLGAYEQAQEELAAVLRESVGMISKGIGLDYGAACNPSGGCC